MFGKEIGQLVDGVTKLSRLELQSDHTKHAENFRKLVLAMSNDIRVLLVKLADRLHNMRTLHFIKDPEKRRRIALETMEIYAPLAERMGMHEIKDELENLAFAQLNPEAYASIVQRLSFLREQGTDLADQIIAELGKVLTDAGVKCIVSGREKTPYSIWRKMQKKRIEFEQLSDIMAFRIVVDDTTACYQALGVIHSEYSMIPGRFKDYISTPKPNDYRSLHTGVIGPQRQRIEIQIRTPEMHEVAELGVAAHWQLQAGPAGADRRAAVSLAARAAGHPGARRRAGGVPRAHQARDVPGPGVLLHAEGRPDRPAARRDAGRFRLCGPLRGRRHLRRRQDQRPHRAAAQRAAERRPGRDRHLEGADAVADLGALRRHRQGARPHPPLHPHPAARAVSRARPRRCCRRSSSTKATNMPTSRWTAC